MDININHVHSVKLSGGAALAVVVLLIILFVIAMSKAYPMMISLLPQPSVTSRQPMGFHK
jgi:hypothetical protein